jgi:hypothetical protein
VIAGIAVIGRLKWNGAIRQEIKEDLHTAMMRVNQRKKWGWFLA